MLENCRLFSKFVTMVTWCSFSMSTRLPVLGKLACDENIRPKQILWGGICNWELTSEPLSICQLGRSTFRVPLQHGTRVAATATLIHSSSEHQYFYYLVPCRQHIPLKAPSPTVLGASQQCFVTAVKAELYVLHCCSAYGAGRCVDTSPCQMHVQSFGIASMLCDAEAIAACTCPI